MSALLLRGPRVHLRPVRESDVGPRYVGWLNDRETNRYMETRFARHTRKTVLSFVRDKRVRRRVEPFFCICLNGTGEHIGNVKLGPIHPRHKTADVSLFIGEKSLWGKGYASEAIALVTKFAFERLRLNKLEAGCYEANRASAKAFARCGYAREGFRKAHVIYGGKPMSVVLLGLTAADFRRKRK